jgi:hypothetical protein
MDWREIPGFPGYNINETGNLRTLSGYSLPLRGSYRKKYRLRLDGRAAYRSVEELLALAFSAEPPAPEPLPPASAEEAPGPEPEPEPDAPASEDGLEEEAPAPKPRPAPRCYARCWRNPRGFICARSEGASCDNAYLW